jgi:regulator of protease activity HflC (stomatin/prohibitin superfamily)
MSMKQNIMIGFVAVLAIFFLSIFAGSWYTVDQTERAVVLENGKFVGVSGPGFHMKTPFIEDYIKFPVTELKENFGMAAYSRDQQNADITVSVNYRAIPDAVGQIYSDYGSMENMMIRLIGTQVQEQTKIVFGRFTAVRAIQEREALGREIGEAIIANIHARDENIMVNVQLEGVKFSGAYEQSIEQRMLAEVDVEKMRQTLERERIEAEIKVTQATAEADSIRLKGQAEADAIAARGQSLNDNPDLVALVQAERWNGVLPTTMVPSGALPILGLN